MYLWPLNKLALSTYFVVIDTSTGAITGCWRALDINKIFVLWLAAPPEGFRFAQATYRTIDGSEASKTVKQLDAYRQMFKPDWMQSGGAT